MPPLARRVQRPNGQPGLGRLRLALGFDRRCRLVVDRVARRPIGLPPDDDAVDRRRRLQPRSRVDDIARDHRLAELRSRAERDQRLARVDRDPNLHVELAELPHAVSHRERRTRRALGVVAVGRRRAEDRDDRVTDELLDDAAERLKLAPDEVVVRRQEGSYVRGVELLRARGEAD